MPFILPPPNFQIIQTVLRSLTMSDWFDSTAANVTACAELVSVFSGKGGMNVEELHARCVDTARELFGKPITYTNSARA